MTNIYYFDCSFLFLNIFTTMARSTSLNYSHLLNFGKLDKVSKQFGFSIVLRQKSFILTSAHFQFPNGIAVVLHLYISPTEAHCLIPLAVFVKWHIQVVVRVD